MKRNLILLFFILNNCVLWCQSGAQYFNLLKQNYGDSQNWSATISYKYFQNNEFQPVTNIQGNYYENGSEILFAGDEIIFISDSIRNILIDKKQEQILISKNSQNQFSIPSVENLLKQLENYSYEAIEVNEGHKLVFKKIGGELPEAEIELDSLGNIHKVTLYFDHLDPEGNKLTIYQSRLEIIYGLRMINPKLESNFFDIYFTFSNGNITAKPPFQKFNLINL